jgi:hypothetical protein
MFVPPPTPPDIKLEITKLIIAYANIEITSPTIAYKIVFFAAVTLVVLPPETTYLSPPMTIIMTLMAPTANNIMLLMVVKMPDAPNKSVAWSMPRAALAPSVIDRSKAYPVETKATLKSSAKKTPVVTDGKHLAMRLLLSRFHHINFIIARNKQNVYLSPLFYVTIIWHGGVPKWLKGTVC